MFTSQEGNKPFCSIQHVTNIGRLHFNVSIVLSFISFILILLMQTWLISFKTFSAFPPDLFILFCAIHYKQTMWMQHDRDTDFTPFPLRSILAVRAGYLLADKMLCCVWGWCFGILVHWVAFGRIIAFPQALSQTNSTSFLQKEAINPFPLPNWLHVGSHSIPHVLLPRLSQLTVTSVTLSPCTTSSWTKGSQNQKPFLTGLLSYPWFVNACHTFMIFWLISN